MAQSLGAFTTGLALSLALIVAIGAQNAFVLRQGLRREHVGAVVLFCALADALLIAAGVVGALGFGARLLAPWFARPRAWQVLDGLIGITMLALAALLVRRLIT